MSSQNGCHQRLHLQRESQLPPAFWEALQDQQVGLTQASLKLLPLHWVSECVRFCRHPLRAESLFPTALQLSHRQIPLAFKARRPGGLVFLVWDPQAGEPDVGLGPHSLGRTSAIVIILLFVGHLEVCILTTVHLCSSYLSRCCSFFISLVVENTLC